MPRRRPGRPRRGDERPTRELVLAAATALFAEHGFDAVGLRDVAAAAGVDVATVAHHTGTKAELYDACFARVFAAEREVLEVAGERARQALAAGRADALRTLHDLVDVFVDFLEDRPETTALWLRRWLEPHRHADLDQRYAAPLYALVEELLATAAEGGALVEPTPHVTVRSLVWAVHGHVVALAAGSGSGARERREFRGFVHRFLDGLYPPASP
ncbi:TetR/AcrR family transcriptional regulator [Micromonospora halotolerans]|uniref:TetR/AcrR family transcriptional regulator n=2 Tax=Micromonospora halotolerans TaxID=709879 RepID=A0ABZ0A6P3_9ACTN|nr:TetR/AcrR family transcriptional regulator [Micromonospora halotolerans]WNM43139.1 TetR/AcrR family transcriptional regulator [Micromonospora halotolerans]